MASFRIQPTSTGVRFTVRLQPRASTTGIVGVYGDALKIRVTAPPVDGAANEELIKLLGRTFEVPGRSITIVAGSGSRTKVVELEGVTIERVRRLVEI